MPPHPWGHLFSLNHILCEFVLGVFPAARVAGDSRNFLANFLPKSNVRSMVFVLTIQQRCAILWTGNGLKRGRHWRPRLLFGGTRWQLSSQEKTERV